jgi:FkbM family methyltransferase
VGLNPYVSVSMWATISKILPEGMIKEQLRKFFYLHIYNRYALNGLIKNINLLDDGTLFLILNNGLNFHVPFWDSFWILREQFIKYKNFHTFKKGDIAIDAGANVGIFTVKAAKTVGERGKVIAIEPAKDILKFLKENIEINHLKNVMIIPKGLWDKKAKKRLYLSDTPGSHSLIYKEHFNNFSEIEVDNLDNLLKSLKLKKVNFIKMDIEGAEIKALKGAKETLKNNNLVMAIEIHGNRLQNIVSLVQKSDYKIDQKIEIGYLFSKTLKPGN